jgi:hypothetical protein
MACTAVAAILLTLSRYQIPAEAVGQLSLSIKVFWAVREGLFATALTFALLAIYWQWKGYASLVQPGQWLLIQPLVDVAHLQIGLFLVTYLRVTGPWGKPFALWSQSEKLLAVVSALYIIAIYLNRALPLLFYAWCAWRVADTRPWRVFFALYAVTSALNFLPRYPIFQLLRPGLIVTSIVMLSVLMWIIATDYRQQHRYWTHWLGVGLCVAITVLEFASGVMNHIGWR